MQCPNCNQTLPDDSEFCQYCGSELKRVCSKCGAELDDDSEFCKKCGKRIDKKSLSKPKAKAVPITKELTDEDIYQEAIRLKGKNTLKSLKESIEKLSSIADYNDSKEQIEYCESKINAIKNNHKKLYIAIGSIALVIILIVLAVVAYIFWVAPEIKYNNAKKELEEKNYEEAKTIFLEMDDYKDSKEMYLETLYQQCISLANQKEYNKAFDLYSKIYSINPKYKDIDVTIKKLHIEYANSLHDDKKYLEAFLQYELGNETTSESYKDSCYSLGKIEFENGNYLDAISYFTKAKDYSNSDEMITECKYQFVVSYCKSDNHTVEQILHQDDIFNYLEELSDADYKDSKSLYKNETSWHLSIAVNSNENDNTTDKERISVLSPIFFHVVMDKGPIDRFTNVTYKVT